MECRLQYAPTWSCTITLRFQTDKHGNLLGQKREFTFGPTLHDRAHVETMLRRAQRAILRPSIDPSAFLDDSDMMIAFPPPLSFSANCVCIQVAGPNVADLYFYDLPGEGPFLSSPAICWTLIFLVGIIANVRDGESEDDIKLVTQLAKSYISKPSCIILLAISCESELCTARLR
jgi:hypothetical protein